MRMLSALGLALVVAVSLAAPAKADNRDDCTANDPGRAIRGCTAIIERGDESRRNRAIAYNNRGSAHWKKGDHDKAIADYTQAIRLKPDYAKAYSNRGIAHKNKGDYDKAIADYTEAIRLKPDDAIAYGHRGNAHLEKGDYHKAIADYSQAIVLDPGYTAAYTNRGQAHEKLGNTARARADFRSALAVPQKYGSGAWAHRTARKRLAALKDDEPKSRPSQPAERPVASTASAPGKRIALVIGNSTYDHVPRLNNPQRDASAVADAFRRLGFAEVVERHDLDAEELRDELKRFGDLALGADWAVIYFAGHGLQVDGRSYLIPTDARLRRAAHVEDEAIPVMRAVRKVRDARKLRMVILDACRDNPFIARMAQSGRVTRSINRGLGRVDPAGGVMVAYAARDGQLAADGAGQHSPFTAALLRHLDTPGLEISLLFRKVRDDVINATDGAQEPFVYGSLPGESFYFRRAAAE